MRKLRGKLWLYVAPAVLCVLDNALTLWGQPSEYWAGNYAICQEGNPVVRWCLEQHPVAVLAEAVLWIALVGVAIVVLPWQVAKVVSQAVTLGHVVGANFWLWHLYGLYWLFPMVLVPSAWLIVWTWERAEDAQAPHDLAVGAAANGSGG